MAKKQAETMQKPAGKQKKRQAPAAEKPQKQRRSLEDIREDRGPRKYTLADCMRFGRIANILFIVFIIICLIYYYSIANKGNYSIPFEVIAYSVETAAFLLFTTGVIWRFNSRPRAEGDSKSARIKLPIAFASSANQTTSCRFAA